MMKSGGNLDDALQERLFVFRRVQPDFFPGFVGLEKLHPIEMLESLLKCVYGMGIRERGFSHTRLDVFQSVILTVCNPFDIPLAFGGEDSFNSGCGR